MDQAKSEIRTSLDKHRDELLTLSHWIHAHPELKFNEHQAVAQLQKPLEQAGLWIDVGIADLPTAFRATCGEGDLHIAVCAEYDALPGIGHACGHNIISAAAVGTALALAPLVKALNIRLTVLGTPGEEGGGGKVLMLERGVFDDIDAAMMIHPFPRDELHLATLAVSSWDITYTGKSAHASAFPHLGVNAADAQTISQVAVGLLRQQLAPGHQVHGIVRRGGDAPNIIPEETVSSYYTRAPDLTELDQLEPRVHACFQAGAIATGAAVSIESNMPRYSEFSPDTELLEIFAANAEEVGRSFPPVDPNAPAIASTDMANVSRELPTIHPWIGIDSGDAVNHQPEFAAHCVSASGDQAVLDGAFLMAASIVDIATNESVRSRLASHR